jgi:CheY-like chemotaxis protein
MSKVLLVIADSFLRRTFERIGNSQDYTVILASGGKDGLNQVKALQPDLILLDLDLPDISGFEFINQVKADPALKEKPIVVLAQDEDEQLKSQLAALKVDEIIRKDDFTPDQVAQKIREHLNIKKE